MLVFEIERDRRIAAQTAAPRTRVRQRVMNDGDVAWNTDLDAPDAPAGQAKHRIHFGRVGSDPVIWVDVDGAETIRLRIDASTGAAALATPGAVTVAAAVSAAVTAPELLEMI